MEKDCRMYHLFVGMALAATLFLTACTSRQESKLLSFYDVNRTEKLSVPFDEEGKEFAKLRDLDAREMEIKVDMPFAKAVKAGYEKSAEKINSQLMEMLLKKSGSLTTEEAVELASVQAKFASVKAKKNINKVIDGVKDLFGGKKDK